MGGSTPGAASAAGESTRPVCRQAVHASIVAAFAPLPTPQSYTLNTIVVCKPSPHACRNPPPMPPTTQTMPPTIRAHHPCHTTQPSLHTSAPCHAMPCHAPPPCSLTQSSSLDLMPQSSRTSGMKPPITGISPAACVAARNTQVERGRVRGEAAGQHGGVGRRGRAGRRGWQEGPGCTAPTSLFLPLGQRLLPMDPPGQ